MAACEKEGTLSGTNTDAKRETGRGETGLPDPGQQPEGEKELSEAEPQKRDTNVLVAYVSATGNTKEAAEKIAEITGADLYEIVPVQQYTAEDLDYGNRESRTSLEMDAPDARPEIGRDPVVLEGYSTLYLGYPIWHGQAPRIMSTFAESYHFDGITVIPFCTSGSSGIGSSGQRFSTNVPEAELQEWIRELL